MLDNHDIKLPWGFSRWKSATCKETAEKTSWTASAASSAFKPDFRHQRYTTCPYKSTSRRQASGRRALTDSNYVDEIEPRLADCMVSVKYSGCVSMSSFSLTTAGKYLVLCMGADLIPNIDSIYNGIDGTIIHRNRYRKTSFGMFSGFGVFKGMQSKRRVIWIF